MSRPWGADISREALRAGCIEAFTLDDPAGRPRGEQAPIVRVRREPRSRVRPRPSGALRHAHHRSAHPL